MCHFWSSTRGCCKPWEIKCQWDCPEHSSDPFICPNCRAKLTMYEHTIEYYDKDTIILTEHYECPECHESVPLERIATYELKKETWNE